MKPYVSTLPLAAISLYLYFLTSTCSIKLRLSLSFNSNISFLIRLSELVTKSEFVHILCSAYILALELPV